ncbi:MAG: pyridoxamine 5'-phosphate oxidase [Rhodothermales bacterium]
MSSIEDLRKEYVVATLDSGSVDADPIRQFEKWFDNARQAGVDEPNACLLATVSADGRPSARVVLLKGFDASGFSFYTNYQSRKGKELDGDSFAALTFWWKPLERQVRIEGSVETVSTEESDRYFSKRPRGSQIGAWASHQSEVLASRDVLEKRIAETEQRFAGREVERPPHWGGYLVVPDSIEFWQGRQSRLHDRIRYRLVDGHGWIIERLSP